MKFWNSDPEEHPGSATLIIMSLVFLNRDFLYYCYLLFQSNEGELEDLADLQDTVKNFFTSILFFCICEWVWLSLLFTLPYRYWVSLLPKEIKPVFKFLNFSWSVGVLLKGQRRNIKQFWQIRIGFSKKPESGYSEFETETLRKAKLPLYELRYLLLRIRIQWIWNRNS